MKFGWIDATVTLRNSMVHWPGDPGITINLVSDKKKGSKYNLSEITMGSHSGTHVDAPLHIIDGPGIDKMGLDIAIGKARVIEIKDKISIKTSELEKYKIRRGERILFRTKNSETPWSKEQFKEDYVFISDDAARFLADLRLKIVGVDYLSVGSKKLGGLKVHKSLLESGAWIVEGLDLSKIKPGRYDFICLPLKIYNGDGAPCRVVLRAST